MLMSYRVECCNDSEAEEGVGVVERMFVNRMNKEVSLRKLHVSRDLRKEETEPLHIPGRKSETRALRQNRSKTPVSGNFLSYFNQNKSNTF